MAQSTRPTWEAHFKPGELHAAERKELPAGASAHPIQRKEPGSDATQLRGARARFDRMNGLPGADRRPRLSVPSQR